MAGILLCALTVSPAAAQEQSPDGLWTALESVDLEARRPDGAQAWIRPERFKAFELDKEALESLLSGVVDESAAKVPGSERVIINLPRPDGSYERFAIWESPVMEPGLQRRMAELGWPMRTYRGESLDRAATAARFDWGGPGGFHAMVSAPAGSYLIDPYWQGEQSLYTSYFKDDFSSKGKSFACGVTERWTARTAPVKGSTGGALRTYRLANAATGEYTQFYGGTQAGAQAAITTSINRVNMVYERDFSARLVLVADNIDLVYTDAATDPYTNNSCSTMLGENQANVDAVIGSADYDIGHVFSTGGGGVATLESPCDASIKARGCTGLSTPMGDPFDIDFVAHEIGHQFGGEHTWNGTAGSCSAGAFASSSAYEPGSGSTIMAYAGICGADNIETNSDDHFHRRSLDQMLAFMSGDGACSTDTAGVNPSAPTVDAGAAYTIPSRTPFELEALDASDNDNDSLTFNWEQFDLGTRAALSVGDDGTQPIFRSWPSSASPIRVFPRLEDLLMNTTSDGETLPTTSRTLNFQVTVRDNRAGGGREGKDSTTVTSTDAAGPFQVTDPNGGEMLTSEADVTWDVANSDLAPVSAATVDILLSTDGGLTYPYTLASATANDGAETVSLPGVETDEARIKVKGTGNIFFDISNADFSIDNGTTPHMLVLLDRTGSMLAIRPSTGNSRCADALELAKQDVAQFYVGNPAGARVAVWTFAGSAPTELTTGFVDQAAATAALNALSPDGCTGSTPLADAMCAAADSLAALGDTVPEKVLAVSSDGGENASSGDCSGPWSTGGPPWDPGSWQEKVEMRIVGVGVVLARFWGSVNRAATGIDPETGNALPPGAVPDVVFFEYLAAVTGGIFQPVGDGDPLPPPFFGASSVLEIPTLGFWGLSALSTLLALAALALLRRRA